MKRRGALIVGIVALSLFGTAQAEVVSGGDVRVTFDGWIRPAALPRSETAPIALHVAGTVEPIGDKRPATLDSITVQINRHAVSRPAACRPAPGRS